MGTTNAKTLALRALRPHSRPVPGHHIVYFAPGPGGRPLAQGSNPPLVHKLGDPGYRLVPRCTPQRRRVLKAAKRNGMAVR